MILRRCGRWDASSCKLLDQFRASKPTRESLRHDPDLSARGRPFDHGGAGQRQHSVSGLHPQRDRLRCGGTNNDLGKRCAICHLPLLPC